MIASPCTKICTLDGSGEYCLGCFRTLDEIARWGTMSDDERARVLNALAGRRETKQQSGISAGF